MKLSKMIWFNAIVSVFCLFCGIYCICQRNTLLGILDILFSVANIYCVLNYIADWWMYSKKVSNKFVFTCSKCEHQFIPTFWSWFFGPHLGSRRYLKCEKCDKRTQMRRK